MEYKRPRDYPKTKAEWWALCKLYRELLTKLVAGYYPGQYKHYGSVTDPMYTASMAEQACRIMREEFDKLDEPAALFGKYIDAENAQAAQLLSATWFGMPESLSAHGYPGFDVLCDLCSECYVLYEDYPNETGEM